MKNIGIAMACFMALHATAQVKIIHPKTTDTKLPTTKTMTKFSPAIKYKLNPAVAAYFAGALPTKTAYVDGRKITTRMVAVDHPGFVTVADKKGPGISQKIKAGAVTQGSDICQSYTVNVSANSENFDVPYSTQATGIYPGAAYMYDEYYKNTVSPKPITWERNPIYIQASSSTSTGKYELVEAPSQRTLDEATGKLKSSLPVNATNASTSITMSSLYNETDFSMKVNAGGAGFGFKADASLGISNNSKKTSFIIDVTQSMYTLNAILPDGDNVTFFKDAAHDKDNQALFISSVTYGRRVLGVVETEFASEKTLADFKASYSAGFAGGYVGLNMLSGMQSAKTSVRLYLVGGSAQTIMVPNATEAAVTNAINNFLKVTSTQNAVPIKFSFRNMAMSGMRYESATDNFTYQQCVPANPVLKYKVTAELQMITNSKQETVKMGLSQWVWLRMNDGRVFPNQNNEPDEIVCWWEGPKTCEQPREFNGTTQLKRTRTFTLTQQQITDEGAHIDIWTKYIAMYRTKIGGSTNSIQPDKHENIYIRDVVNSAQGGNTLTKNVDINFNGRVFSVTYIITATPM